MHEEDEQGCTCLCGLGFQKGEEEGYFDKRPLRAAKVAMTMPWQCRHTDRALKSEEEGGQLQAILPL